MLPAEDRRGEVPPVSTPGEWVMTISAPWSTRALAVSRKDSLWLSIWRNSSSQNFLSYFFILKGISEGVFFLFTMMFPPPGVWLALLREPTLAWALSLKSSFTFSMRTLPPPGDRTEKRRVKTQEAAHACRTELLQSRGSVTQGHSGSKIETFGILTLQIKAQMHLYFLDNSDNPAWICCFCSHLVCGGCWTWSRI